MSDVQGAVERLRPFINEMPSHSLASGGVRDMWLLAQAYMNNQAREAALVQAARDGRDSLDSMLSKVESLLAREVKATLAPYPRSGVEYIGVDPADSPEVRAARAAADALRAALAAYDQKATVQP